VGFTLCPQHPAHGTFLYATLNNAGLIVGLTETPAEVNKLAPDLRQHTEEVLMESLGYSWEQLAALRGAEAYWRKRRERAGKERVWLVPCSFV
jgi:crotonobetainyl-CoA:carnitine CoA-transferase CaiB-like acyl-CoA transferase